MYAPWLSFGRNQTLDPNGCNSASNSRLWVCTHGEGSPRFGRRLSISVANGIVMVQKQTGNPACSKSVRLMFMASRLYRSMTALDFETPGCPVCGTIELRRSAFKISRA